MALTSPAAVSVGTTATLIATGSSAGGGTTVEVYNTDTDTVWLGDSTVTVGSVGVPLVPDGSKAYVLRSGDSLYGRVASGTADITTIVIGGSH